MASDNPSDSPSSPLLTTPPILSTVEDTSAFTNAAPSTSTKSPHAGTRDEEFRRIYEIDRTVEEILEKGYQRIALQFPDELLGDSTRVYGMVWAGVNSGKGVERMEGMEEAKEKEGSVVTEGGVEGFCCDASGRVNCCGGKSERSGMSSKSTEHKVYILADTSYGACCVDEIAAEHVNADVIIHYGRACLSPTTRLPVIHVFTISPLSHPSVLATFRTLFPPSTSLDKKVILMSDVTYHTHLPAIYSALTSPSEGNGYRKLFLTEIVHHPSSPLPNRTLPPSVTPSPTDTPEEKERKAAELREEWELFYISTPLPTLLLVLSSRLKQIHIFPTNQPINLNDPLPISATEPLPTLPLLRRRYAVLTRLRTAPIIGILVSTLSVAHYLPLITHLKHLIRSAGKKSYLVVVGKVNVEKLANFAEIEGWVGVGCWEQGVVGGALTSADGGREYFRPVVTPWELGVALKGVSGGEKRDSRWEWNGEWITDFETLLERGKVGTVGGEEKREEKEVDEAPSPQGAPIGNDYDNPLADLEESTPPEFDLRTGQYVSDSRPLAHIPISHPSPNSTNSPIISTTLPIHSPHSSSSSNSTALTVSHKPTTQSLTRITPVGGVISPSANFLAQNRTWRGLGSDIAYEEDDEDDNGRDEPTGAKLEIGRSGVARGYVMVGDGGVGKGVGLDGKV